MTFGGITRLGLRNGIAWGQGEQATERQDWQEGSHFGLPVPGNAWPAAHIVSLWSPEKRDFSGDLRQH
jgi:hypothetical protein